MFSVLVNGFDGDAIDDFFFFLLDVVCLEYYSVLYCQVNVREYFIQSSRLNIQEHPLVFCIDGIHLQCMTLMMKKRLAHE